MESVEDGNTLLVAGSQYWTSNRYMDTILGRSIKVFWMWRTRHEILPVYGNKGRDREETYLAGVTYDGVVSYAFDGRGQYLSVRPQSTIQLNSYGLPVSFLLNQSSLYIP